MRKHSLSILCTKIIMMFYSHWGTNKGNRYRNRTLTQDLPDMIYQQTRQDNIGRSIMFSIWKCVEELSYAWGGAGRVAFDIMHAPCRENLDFGPLTKFTHWLMKTSFFHV